ncbi:MAG: hypothetical protein B9S26_14225 [Opitutia bacterium Tous-C4FEB]|nr:MAG: hypothetical protein B9S26_14225 [Opitutae bacterium Tous-C4FEB]
MKHPRPRPLLIVSLFTRLRRNAVDLRIVNDVREGRAAAEAPAYRAKYRLLDTAPKTGIIDTPAHAGGWPELKFTETPPDTDGDGMPAARELGFKPDPNNAADGVEDADRDGYTNLEEYLNATDPRVFADYVVRR